MITYTITNVYQFAQSAILRTLLLKFARLALPNAKAVKCMANVQVVKMAHVFWKVHVLVLARLANIILLF